MDEKFFSITNKDALKAALIKNKSYIITRLNNDFQKPYCQCEHRETTRSGVWTASVPCSVLLSAARLSSSG